MSRKYRGFYDYLSTLIYQEENESEDKKDIDATPRNCNNPCCYGTRRNMCWPCIKKLMEEQNATKKR